jgi:hypothetical protein
MWRTNRVPLIRAHPIGIRLAHPINLLQPNRRSVLIFLFFQLFRVTFLHFASIDL